ncbi:hypothetical protein JL09_g5903, partial [Pichia kudriavzevii]
MTIDIDTVQRSMAVSETDPNPDIGSATQDLKIQKGPVVSERNVSGPEMLAEHESDVRGGAKASGEGE